MPINNKNGTNDWDKCLGLPEISYACEEDLDNLVERLFPLNSYA